MSDIYHGQRDIDGMIVSRITASEQLDELSVFASPLARQIMMNASNGRFDHLGPYTSGAKTVQQILYRMDFLDSKIDFNPSNYWAAPFPGFLQRESTVDGIPNNYWGVLKRKMFRMVKKND